LLTGVTFLYRKKGQSREKIISGKNVVFSRGEEQTTGRQK
jgi:hypothetical protein